MDHQIPQNNRIEILDIFRGFAVFGIFVVNIEIMNCAIPNQGLFAEQWNSEVDHTIFRIMQLFFYSKFFPIFSFLFGLGISMQAMKLFKKGQKRFSFYMRRMLFLFIIGIAHILFIWNGDVVHLYAILGLLIVFILPLSNKWLVGGSVFILLFPFYDQVAFWLFDLILYSPESFLMNYPSEKITEILRNGPYFETINFRIHDYLANIPLLFVYLAPLALAMFLLGVFFGKNQLEKKLDVVVKATQKPMLLLMVITNVFRILFIFFLPKWEIYRNEIARPIFFKLMYLSDLAFGLFYLWLLAFIWYFTPWKKLIVFLKYPGKMALTNYIMQSIIGLFLFSSIGLGWYEKLSPARTFFFAIGVFIFQCIYSKFWLSYFQFGPLEWLWRCFTYQKIFPIKKIHLEES